MPDSPPPTVRCPQCNAECSSENLGLYENTVCPSCRRSFRANARLGAYEMIGELGIGGMSLVLRARDVVLGRELALKILNETYRNDPQRVARFERECALMAKVKHAHVARVYAAGRQNDYCYIAMELIDGSNVESEIAERGAFDPSEALRIIRQVAEGLQAAHKAGLLHRDMKPANILLTSAREAKVVDFGLALLSSESDTEEMVWATPYYAAPETLMRKKEDARADIYSLGMTLRHMLTGVPPFAHGLTSIHALLTIKKKLPKLIREVPYLPTALCDLVDHMSAFSVWNRPRGYESLLREIKETADLVERSAEDATAYRAHTPTWHRHRKLRRSLLTAGTAALILLPFVLFEACSTKKQPAPKPAAAPKTVSPLLPERDTLLSQAERALEKSSIDEAGEFFHKLSRETTYVMRAWSVLHAYICLTLLDDSERIDALLAVDALSLAAVPTPSTETTRCVFEFMRRATVGQGEDFTPRPNQNEDLIASVELASGMTQLRRGRARLAHTHLSHAFSLLQQAKESPYRGYVAFIEPLITGLKKIVELDEIPQKTAVQKGQKAKLISRFWEEEGAFLPWPLRSAFRDAMLAHAQQLKEESDAEAPREIVLQKLTSGQYAGAAILFDAGNYPASASKRKVLFEMCDTAERFCRLVQLKLTEAAAKTVPELKTLQGREFSPADALRYGQGSFWFKEGGNISIRELDPASLTALYAAAGTTGTDRAAKAREMRMILTYLHGEEETAKKLFEEERARTSDSRSPFLQLWQQWMEAAEG